MKTATFLDRGGLWERAIKLGPKSLHPSKDRHDSESWQPLSASGGLRRRPRRCFQDAGELLRVAFGQGVRLRFTGYKDVGIIVYGPVYPDRKTMERWDPILRDEKNRELLALAIHPPPSFPPNVSEW